VVALDHLEGFAPTTLGARQFKLQPALRIQAVADGRWWPLAFTKPPVSHKPSVVPRVMISREGERALVGAGIESVNLARETSG